MPPPPAHPRRTPGSAGGALWRIAVYVGLTVVALMLPFTSNAQDIPEAEWLRPVRDFTLAAARHASPGRRIEVAVGAFDPRLRLAPCQRAEPFLPDMARLWGRSRIGLRCAQGGPAWRVFVPVTVKVFGPAVVAVAALPVGRVITPADLAQAEVDLAEEATNAFTDPAAAVGRALLRPLAAGQAVRQAHLRARVWFAAGDEVKVIARGAGFSATGAAQALTPGIEGQPARVKTESGRIVSGRAVAQGTIDLSL
jgi:flagellar basal body P-ring formation protein FlgA